MPRSPAGDLAGMPVLLALPAEDARVSVDRAQETARLPGEMGGSVALEVQDEPEHVVTDEAVAATRRLLAARV